MTPVDLQAQLDRLRQSDEIWDASPELWASLDERLAAAGRDGYAFAHERYLAPSTAPKIWTVAVPIIASGRTAAALSSLMLRRAGQRQQLLSKNPTRVAPNGNNNQCTALCGNMKKAADQRWHRPVIAIELSPRPD